MNIFLVTMKEEEKIAFKNLIPKNDLYKKLNLGKISP